MPGKLLSSDLVNVVDELEAWATKPAQTPGEVARNLTGIYHALRDVDLQRYDTRDIADAAAPLIQRLFRARMHMREQLGDWASRGMLTEDVQRALRDLFRAMRYAGDMLGEHMIGYRRLDNGARLLRAFRGRDSNTLVNPRFVTGEDLPFHSGDLLMVRGRHHNSAAIARIGDIDSQYSHLGMIYIDPTGRHWLVEVLIEEGGVIKPLDGALDHDLGRAVLFRHRDPVLAQRAAFIAHEHVKQSLSHYGKPILYDFTMNNEGYKKLFCSKLIRMAFDKASEGHTMLSSFPTRLKMANPDFFRRIGVTAETTFAPGDMELEPDFDIVAEWQDYRATASLRHQDLVMDKLFEWMDTRGLSFRETTLINVIARFGRLAAGFSNTVKSLISEVVPKVPPHMPRKTIATIVMLHKTADPIVAEIDALEQERISVFGYPLHPREVLEYLDRFVEKTGGEIGYLAPAPERAAAPAAA